MRYPTVLSCAALIAAAIAATSVSAIASPAHDADDDAPAVVLPDRPLKPATPNGVAATTLPNGWRVTPAGRHLALPGDMPLKMQLSPDGKYLFVLTGGFHDHGLSVFDVATEKRVSGVDYPQDWAGLAIDPTGKTVYISPGNVDAPKADDPKAAPRQIVLRCTFDPATGRANRQDGLLAPAGDKSGHWVAGIVADRTGTLYGLDTNGDALYRVDPQTGHGTGMLPTGYRPYGLALSPDGATIAISNWGDKSVWLVDHADLTEKARIAVGSHPCEMAWSVDGKRLFVACAGSNSISVITSGQVTETIQMALDPKAPIGSTPVALAVSPDGKRLFVANAGNNDVAVVDITEASASRVIGFIPTGWYPSALAVSADNKRLFVGIGKGLAFRANAPAAGPNPWTNYDGKTKQDYIGNVLSGAVSVVDLPDADGLEAYTKQVYANVPNPTAGVSPQRIAAATSAFHKIKHVLFIIRENRTYDQVFGDVAKGNGDPSITMYGESVTPNAHALARQTVLLDNLYCNGEVSESGHQWCNAAYATDFTEKAWVNSYSGRGEPDADERLTASPAGYLWDACEKHHLTYRTYGEFSSFKSTPNAPPTYTGYPTLNGHACVGWDYHGQRDTDLAKLFLDELKSAEKTGDWPNYMVMSLGEDHTAGLSAGAFTPNAAVASNDQALGKIVEGISHSRFWSDTAIFVMEDNAQNGPDHVDAHRTVGLVISPYIRQGAVDSTLYTTASFVHTMELILGLPPMTQFDADATPLYNSFTDQPTQTAFSCLPPRVDLFAKNPAETPAAKQSAKLDFSDYDRADPDILNQLLWHAAHPNRPLPAPVRSPALVASR